MTKSPSAPGPSKLEDVARLAGVSTATVSRCLNAPNRVLPATRERVLAAVATLGYAPNYSARALAARQTFTMGAIIPTMENAIFARGIQAFQEELGRHGYTLLIASSSYKEALEEEQIRTLTARGSDGLLLIGHHRHARVRAFLRERGIPTLVAWAYDPAEERLPSMGFDNARVMASLARAVMARGHQRIGVISAETAANDRAKARIDGIRSAIAEAGLSEADLTIVETQYGFETGATAFRQLMDRSEPPTAIMCGNDVLAVGALRAAQRMGFDVPGDVSITGFDDIELATLVDPPLTTTHVPHREMGRRAAEMLVRMVADKHLSAESTELQVDIVLRDTLGPAPT
ncbi:MAG: LacI family DNA-binding transcriptional regulator [Pseudomonadota bacterium]